MVVIFTPDIIYKIKFFYDTNNVVYSIFIESNKSFQCSSHDFKSFMVKK